MEQEYQSFTLIYACAWCPEKSWTQLQEKQAYTHGICAKHKFLLITKFKIHRYAKKIDAGIQSVILNMSISLG
jgi:hypothetical protein